MTDFFKFKKCPRGQIQDNKRCVKDFEIKPDKRFSRMKGLVGEFFVSQDSNQFVSYGKTEKIGCPFESHNNLYHGKKLIKSSRNCSNSLLKVKKDVQEIVR